MSGPILAVHPEHVCICHLASALINPSSAKQGWGHGFDGPTVQRQLAWFLLEEVQDVSTPVLSSIGTLLTRLQQQLGQGGTVLARAVISAMDQLKSPDDMMLVNQHLAAILAPPGTTPAEATDASSIGYITTSSPLGLFLRRVRLGLGSMTVQGLARLSGQIQQQLRLLYSHSKASHSDSSAGVTATAAGTQQFYGRGTNALKDPAVLDAYLNGLISAVEAQGASLPASTVAAAAAPLQRLHSQLPKLEYVHTVAALAHNDMHAALASLHKYFDSSGSSAQAAGNPAAATSSSGAGSKGKGRQQAALHSLTALHAQLGHPQEALAALQELLRLGQQQGDDWGLLHALASLCSVLAMSEGLQGALMARNSSNSGSGKGMSILDLRITEQQLQLQALLRRCLGTARDMRVPHIAAFAAVALCRFQLQHAATSSSRGPSSSSSIQLPGSAHSSAIVDGSSSSAATSIMVQRMLLDVCTLEHQAAVAAASPATPAVAVQAPAMPGQQPQPSAARSTDLYNPTEAFGTGTSSTTPGNVLTPGSNSNKAQPVGLGWKASAAGVSQSLATGQLVAAAALQLHGATSLAMVRLLMLLTAPVGTLIHIDVTASNNAQTACVQQQQQHGGGSSSSMFGQEPKQPMPQLVVATSSSVTACATRCEDVAAAWAMVAELVQATAGVAAAEYALSLAPSHLKAAPPRSLVAAQQMVRLHAALQRRDISTARLACQELQGLPDPLPQQDTDLQLAAAEAEALMLAESGCCHEAHTAAASLFAAAAAASMQPQAVRALVLMSRAALQAGDCAGALPYTLSAMLHCQQLQLDAMLPEVVLLLSDAWQGLSSESSGFVLSMLQQVLPMAHSCGAAKVLAEVQLSTCKVMLGRLRVGDGTDGDVVQTASNVLLDIGEQASACGQMFQDISCWHKASASWMLAAHVFNAAGQQDKRDFAAGKWHKAKQVLAAAFRL